MHAFNAGLEGLLYQRRPGRPAPPAL